jgi:hypothetical protein
MMLLKNSRLPNAPSSSESNATKNIVKSGKKQLEPVSTRATSNITATPDPLSLNPVEFLNVSQCAPRINGRSFLVCQYFPGNIPTRLLPVIIVAC